MRLDEYRVLQDTGDKRSCVQIVKVATLPGVFLDDIQDAKRVLDSPGGVSGTERPYRWQTIAQTMRGGYVT
jgi:hypothetical protein